MDRVPGGLQSLGSQGSRRLGYDLVTKQQQQNLGYYKKILRLVLGRLSLF